MELMTLEKTMEKAGPFDKIGFDRWGARRYTPDEILSQRITVREALTVEWYVVPGVVEPVTAAEWVGAYRERFDAEPAPVAAFIAGERGRDLLYKSFLNAVVASLDGRGSSALVIEELAKLNELLTGGGSG